MPAHQPSRGVTLIEMLVVVVLTASLATLLLPGLARSRQDARRVQCLSNLRFNAIIFHMYAGDFCGLAPYYTDPLVADPIDVRPGEPQTRPPRFFWGFDRWNYALAEQYLDGNPFAANCYPPTYPYGSVDPNLRPGETPYHYSCTFIADARFWNPSTRTGPSQWGPQRIDAVVFPSAKCLLTCSFVRPAVRGWRGDPPPLPDNPLLETALTDGSARVVKGGAEGVSTGDGRWTAPIHQSAGLLGAHTVDGIRGRDIR